MNFSPYGALSQLFVMEGLAKYCDMIIENEADLIADYESKQSDGISVGVNVYSWIEVAKNVKKRMEDFYNREIPPIED